MQRIERTINFSHYRVTVESVSGRFTGTDGPLRKPHQSFAQLLQPEGAYTEVNWRNDEECGIEGYNINAAPQKVHTNSTSYLTTTTEQKDGIFKGTLSSYAVVLQTRLPPNAKQNVFDKQEHNHSYHIPHVTVATWWKLYWEPGVQRVRYMWYWTTSFYAIRQCLSYSILTKDVEHRWHSALRVLLTEVIHNWANFWDTWKIWKNHGRPDILDIHAKPSI